MPECPIAAEEQQDVCKDWFFWEIPTKSIVPNKVKGNWTKYVWLRNQLADQCDRHLHWEERMQLSEESHALRVIVSIMQRRKLGRLVTNAIVNTYYKLYQAYPL